MAALEALSENEEELLAFEEKLNTEGKAALGPEGFEMTKGMCSWVKGTKKISEIKFTPSVIEPSFGKREGERDTIPQVAYGKKAEDLDARIIYTINSTNRLWYHTYVYRVVDCVFGETRIATRDTRWKYHMYIRMKHKPVLHFTSTRTRN